MPAPPFLALGHHRNVFFSFFEIEFLVFQSVPVVSCHWVPMRGVWLCLCVRVEKETISNEKFWASGKLISSQ